VPRNPTGGTSAWHKAKLDPKQFFFGIDCPTSHRCVTTDSDGNVFTASQPTGGVSAWHEAHIDPQADERTAVACPSANLCVVGDSSGDVLSSTNPTGGASSWHDRVLGSGHDSALNGVACASPHLCVAFDGNDGAVLSSADPNHGGTWRLGPADPFASITSLTCLPDPGDASPSITSETL
jgi:hypothetical protein